VSNVNDPPFRTIPSNAMELSLIARTLIAARS
jgi:hypothetical protein